ncbi:AzlD domain-containing protein [Bacillus amyloliquefaciens]|uniref:AzlD domain-containing protein n=1 Tax=Bacillus amyloliquefaciens TaxID=1390 RepID=UPI00336B22D4
MTTLSVTIGCCLVTVNPRVLPFILIRNISLPESALMWLSYAGLHSYALVAENCIIQSQQTLLFNWSVVFVLIPTRVIAVKTKSLTVKW